MFSIKILFICISLLSLLPVYLTYFSEVLPRGNYFPTKKGEPPPLKVCYPFLWKALLRAPDTMTRYNEDLT